MADRAAWRLRDMRKCVVEINAMLAGKSFDDMLGEPITRTALERFLESLNEASRHAPEDWKVKHGPDIPWRQVGDLANHIRHAYHWPDAEVLWSIYEDDLGALKLVIDDMLAAHGSDQPRSLGS